MEVTGWLREALRRKERECEELIDQLKSLQEGILDNEKRMEEKMAAQMTQIEEYVNGRLEDACSCDLYSW